MAKENALCDLAWALRHADLRELLAADPSKAFEIGRCQASPSWHEAPPLYWAVSESDRDAGEVEATVRVVLFYRTHPACREHPNYRFWYPFHSSIILERSLDPKHDLINYSIQDSLIIAARNGYHGAVVALLEAGGDRLFNNTADRQHTLIITCIRNGYVGITRTLLVHGGYRVIDAVNGDGNTALHYACDNACEQSGELVKLVLSAGCYANVADAYGLTNPHKTKWATQSVNEVFETFEAVYTFKKARALLDARNFVMSANSRSDVAAREIVTADKVLSSLLGKRLCRSKSLPFVSTPQVRTWSFTPPGSIHQSIGADGKIKNTYNSMPKWSVPIHPATVALLKSKVGQESVKELQAKTQCSVWLEENVAELSGNYCRLSVMGKIREGDVLWMKKKLERLFVEVSSGEACARGAKACVVVGKRKRGAGGEDTERSWQRKDTSCTGEEVYRAQGRPRVGMQGRGRKRAPGGCNADYEGWRQVEVSGGGGGDKQESKNSGGKSVEASQKREKEAIGFVGDIRCHVVQHVLCVLDGAMLEEVIRLVWDMA